MDQVRHWNRWYDGLPELLRFPLVIAVLVLVGAVNMALTVASGFPFGLLVLLAILVLSVIRIPYLLGTDNLAVGHSAETHPPPMPSNADWLHHWNDRYESLPELWRFQVVVWALVLVGALNMALTIGGRFPFGLLVFLTIVAIGAVRLPYVMGWGYGRPATTTGAAHAAPAQSEALAAPLERLEPPPARTVTLLSPGAASDSGAPERSGEQIEEGPPAGRDQFGPEARPPAA